MKEEDNGYILDRWEEGWAVLVGPQGQEISLQSIPQSAQPGDTYVLQDGQWTPVDGGLAERKARIADKRNKLFGK